MTMSRWLIGSHAETIEVCILLLEIHRYFSNLHLRPYSFGYCTTNPAIQIPLSTLQTFTMRFLLLYLLLPLFPSLVLGGGCYENRPIEGLPKDDAIKAVPQICDEILAQNGGHEFFKGKPHEYRTACRLFPKAKKNTNGSTPRISVSVNADDG